jgi:hypothetical protein
MKHAGNAPLHSDAPLHISPATISILSLGIFIGDFLAPSGLAVSLLYVVPLVLAFFLDREHAPLFVGLLVTVLLWMSVALKLEDPAPYGLLNRS